MRSIKIGFEGGVGAAYAHATLRAGVNQYARRKLFDEILVC